MLVLQSLGPLLLVIGRHSPWLGRLPGDIHYRGQNVSCFISITTAILLSIVLTVLLNLVIRLLKYEESL
jgi:heme/copper-type cytochrome/quinol oxidase subunit 2